MKSRTALSILLGFTAFLIVLALPSQGQVRNLLTFTLTEPASVRDVVIPAGEVTVEQLNLSNGSPILLFRGSDGRTVSVITERVSMSNDQTADGTQIVLRRTATGLEIDKIWISGQAFGYHLFPAE